MTERTCGECGTQIAVLERTAAQDDPNRIPNPYTCGACDYVTDEWDEAKAHRAEHAAVAQVYKEFYGEVIAA